MARIIQFFRSLKKKIREASEERERKRMEAFEKEATDPKNITKIRDEKIKDNGQYFLDDDGFHFKFKNNYLELKWADVREIRVYKQDCWCFDVIHLVFVLDEDKEIEITEEPGDFELVTNKMEEVFPGIPESWWHDVAFPAYEANYAILWPQKKQGLVHPPEESS